jgi:serine/threonine protein kinase/WD40 repeat protein
MGNQLAASGAAATVNITDVSTQLQYVSSLGGKRRGRLFTSMHCLRSSDVPGDPPADVVVKVFVRAPDDKLQAQLITKHAEDLAVMENKFEVNFRRNQDAACNILFYQELDRRNERYCKLQRPYVHYSLLERLHVRPYLDDGEKLFACYQLLHGLSQLHDQFQCVHGDLKPENVLINGRGWVYITDVSPFKPVALPCDNPADFEFYYDTAETRNCCISPEKFYDASAPREEVASKKHTPQNDVFSAGCVIAHVLTGEALFRLATLLEFRAKPSVAEKEVMLRSKLAPFSLAASAVNLICEMLCPGADQRLSAAKLIEKYIPSVFPPFFPFLHMNVLPPVLRRPPDTVLHFLWSRFDDILHTVDRCAVDAVYAQRISQVSHNPPRAGRTVPHQPQPAGFPVGDGDLVASLSMSLGPSVSAAYGSPTDARPPLVAGSVSDLPPYDGSLPPQQQHRTLALSLLLPSVCSAMRHCVTPDARIKGLQILRRSATLSQNDNTKRDVLLPFALFCVKDSSLGYICRALAIEALSAICAELSSQCPTGESMLFEDLVLPAIYEAAKEGHPAVTLSVARVLPSILKLALEYLHRRQVHHTGGSTWLSGYDFQLFGIINNGWECIKLLFKLQDPMIKIAVVRQAPAIVRLIGDERSQDELIPMLTTMIGEPSIEVKRELLRYAILCFIELKCPKLHFLHFFIDEGLRQEDIPCIANTIAALTSLVRAKKLPVENAVQLVHQVVPQVAHPSVWVYSAARRLVEVASQLFSPCDILLHLEPAIRPFLTYSVPLSSLTSFSNVVRQDISFATGVDGVTRHDYKVCSEYADLFPSGSPSRIMVPPKSRERSFADVIIDVSHVDVGFPRNVELNSKLVVWPMCFKPTVRQMKRLVRRGTINYVGQGIERSMSITPSTGGANGSIGSPQTASQRVVVPYGMNVAAVGSISGPSGAVQPGSMTSTRNFSSRTRSVFPGTENSTSQANFSMSGNSVAFSSSASATNGSMSGFTNHASSSSVRPTAAVMATSRDHSGPIYALCSARGVLVSGGAKGVVKVWELNGSSNGADVGGTASMQPGVTRLIPVTVKDAVPPESTVLSIEFLREGHGGADMVVGMGVSDGSARFMEPESGTIARIAQLSIDGGAVTCSQRFSGDVMFFGTAMGEVVAVDLRSSSRNGVVWRAILPVGDSAITCMTAVATRDNIASGFPALACGTVAGTVALFDLRMRVQLQRLDTSVEGTSSEERTQQASSISPATNIRSTRGAILSMVVDPSFCSKLNPSSVTPAVIISTASKTVSRFDLVTGKKTLILECDVPTETRTMMQLPRTMCLFTAGSDRRVRVWDFSQPANSYTLFCPPQCSPKYALDRNIGAVPVIKEGKMEKMLHPQHEENITCMAAAIVRQKHHLVTGARDGSLTIWHNFTQTPAAPR